MAASCATSDFEATQHRGTENFAVSCLGNNNIESLLHFLNPVEVVGLVESVASQYGRPCLADINPEDFGLPTKTAVHRTTCRTFSKICFEKATFSPSFGAVKSKLDEWRKVPGSMYMTVEAADIIGIMLLYSADAPIRFYALIGAQFNSWFVF